MDRREFLKTCALTTAAAGMGAAGERSFLGMYPQGKRRVPAVLPD